MTSGAHNSLRSYVRSLQVIPPVRAAKSVLRTTRRQIPDAWRMATNRHRALPSLVIVGAQKAGTTQLYASLLRHPRCFGAVTKEVQYFSKLSHRTVAWYRSRFPFARRVAAAGGICMEASPSYLPTPQALRRMYAVLPGAKLVVLVRDPVERAFSHYQHYRTRQMESRSFPEAISECLRHRSSAVDRRWPMHHNPEPLLDYVARGYYALQLEVLFQLFPREQVKVIDSSKLFEDTNAVCQSVCHFVGLERHEVTPKKIFNRGRYRETIDAETAQLLRDHYREHDQLLVERLNRRFSWMEATSIPLSVPAPASANAAA